MRISRPVVRCASFVLAAASTAVFAEDNSVQIYGTLNVDFENVQARGATSAGPLPDGAMGAPPNGLNVLSRNRVTQNSSNLGFRGSERIAPDLSAFFQIESGIAVDAGGSNLASRNTAIGLNSSSWGSIRMGQWDTPYKSISGAVDPMYFTGITYTGAIIGTPGFGVGPVTIGAPSTSADGKTMANGANASFERRQGNIVQYWMPSFAGVSVRLAYSANENRTSSSASVTQVNPYIASGSVEYDVGRFYFAYAYEQHSDYFGLDALVPAAQATPVAAVNGSPSASSRDQGQKFVARMTVGGTQLGLLAEQLRYAKTQSNAAPGAFNRYQRQAVAVTLVQKVGSRGTLRGLVGKAQDGSCSRFDGSACSTSGLGARQFSIGYSETLSKRTDLYAFYTQVANESRGSYQFANAAGIGATPGSSSIGYVLGIRHTF
jgi:predicted porin